VGAYPTDVVSVPAGIDAEWRGVTVCMHVRDYQCTTASMVADLPADPGQPIRVWASLGTPCTGVFLPVAVLSDGDGGAEAVVPAVLGDPVAWSAFSALSRAVEAPGDEGHEALAAARRHLAPIEVSAWSRADELWSAGGSRRDWHDAADEWDSEVRSALAALAAS
jgi:hypothetical protein